MEKTIHQGRNVKRFREMLGVKQDSLAFDLGLSQQSVSALEQKEVIEEPLLKQIAELLKVPAEAIKNFDEEQAVNIIANTFGDNACVGNPNSNFNFNPVEKLVQLHEEKIALYERMLKEKDEMMERLQNLIDKK